MPGTRPAHIAVVNLPMLGHVNPTLGVVQELVRRGHRVTYAISEHFVHHVKAAGAEPVLYPVDAEDGSQPPERLSEGFARAVHVSLGALPTLIRAYSADRPDLILHDVYGFAGLVLAAQWQLPTVLFSPTHLSYDGVIPELFDGIPEIPALPAFPDLAAAFTSRGLDPARLLKVASPAYAIAALPRAFQRRPDTVTAGRVAYTGPLLGDRSHQGTWRPPRADARVLLISLGSQFTRRHDFYRACVEAFAETEHHVVMPVGFEVDPSDLGPIPANVEIHAHVPQLSVLSHAEAFITHAGMGGTMEAVAHGVPMVAVPQMAEQRVNAAQIEHLRLGVHLPREQATPEALRAAVAKVIASPEIREGLRSLRAELATAGGAAAAADLIEEALACGSHEPR